MMRAGSIDFMLRVGVLLPERCNERPTRDERVKIGRAKTDQEGTDDVSIAVSR